jgi:two-component system cell cycle response regulator DivK
VANETILIVEDNEKNRKLARDVLQFHGFTILETDNAEDGVRMAKELRAEESTRDIPAIAFTASAMTEDRQRIMAAGFEGLQTKPIHVKEFVQAVKDAVEKSTAAKNTTGKTGA